MADVTLERFSLELPAMYADHHVTEVRRILLELPGVQDVYASSAFGVVEGNFDPGQTNLDVIRGCLAESGYLGAFAGPSESGLAVVQGESSGSGAYFRHTASYEQTRLSVGFGQTVINPGRPMWPCPGMGTIKKQMEE